MTRALRRTCLAAIVLPAIVLASSSDCRALDPVSTIRSQVAAAVYTQQWGQILWGLVTTQTGTETPSFGEPVFNPDGSVTQSFVTADGTETVLTSYPDGSAAALYGQTPPLVNVSRKPGQWQTFNVFFSAPVFAGDKLVSPAHMTVLHNGVFVQINTELTGPTNHNKPKLYEPHKPRLPFTLQGSKSPVEFRNIWIRDLAPQK